MLIFFQALIWTFFFLLLLTLAGGFSVIPFAKVVNYPLLIAPIMGLFFVVIGTSIFYNVLNLSMLTSTITVLIGCFLLTALSILTTTINFKKNQSTLNLSSESIKICLFLFLFIGCIVYLNFYASIYYGEPTLLYTDGSDHLGYTQVADWINQHTITQRPSGNSVYESWPSIMFNGDPRFGSFFTMAFISLIYNKSGMFSYDMACSVVLSCVFLAVAGVFSRSYKTLILLCLGLFTCYWFDYGRSGFFGKILGYPSGLFVVGLFLITPRPFSVAQLIMLSTAVVGAAIVYPAMIAGGFILFAGGLFILLHLPTLWGKLKTINAINLKNDFMIWLFLLGLAVLTTGTLSRPIEVFQSFPQKSVYGWSFLVPWFDLDTYTGHSPDNFLSESQLFYAFIFFVLIATCYLLVAIKKRNFVSCTLLLTPCIILLIIISQNAQYMALQLTGVFYAWFLCAAIWLIDSFNSEKKQKITQILFISLYCFTVLLHVPRFYADIKRYAGSSRVLDLQFSQKEMNKLRAIVGKNKAIVDVNSSMLAIPLMVEFGRNNQELEWTAQGWEAIVSYRHWPVPPLDNFTKYWIVMKNAPLNSNCALKLQTRQYNLLECKKR